MKTQVRWMLMLSLVGCAARGGSTLASRETGDASAGAGEPSAEVTTAPSPVAAVVHPALAAIRNFAPFHALGGGARLAASASGYTLAQVASNGGVGSFRPVGPRLDVTLPRRADGTIHIGRDDRRGAWIELRALDVAAVDATVSDGALVFEGAAAGMDIVHAVDAARFEDVRLVRNAEAARAIRYAVTLGPDVHDFRAIGDRFVARDASGRDVLATAPAFAVDANGAVVALALSAHDGIATLALPERASFAFPVAIDPTWTITSTSPGPVSGGDDFIVQLPSLPDGRLLLGTPFNAPQAYNPTTDTFAPVAPLVPTGNASSQSQTRLKTGKILLAGGFDSVSATSKAWLYDPIAGATPTGSMKVARVLHAATVLKDGRVLITGGGAVHSGAATIATAEIYDPSTGIFSDAAPMNVARAAHSATLLNDGRVLVALGFQVGGVGPAVEIYDPVKNLWTLLPNLATARYEHSATLLPDGRVAIVGGTSNFCCPHYSDVDLFDPLTSTFSPGAPLPAGRSLHAAFVSNDGRLVVAGGNGLLSGGVNGILQTAVVYDAVKNSWISGASLAVPREGGFVGALAGGRVLWAGGQCGSGTCNDAVVYQPDAITDPTKCEAGSFFVDGRCCDRACTGVCEACDTAGREGTCWPVSGQGPRAGHGTGSDCGAFVCANGACATRCATDAACVLGNYCDLMSGQCLPQKANSGGCAADDECVNGHCADGVCCNAACTGDCQACDVAGKFGTCASITGPQHGGRTACAPFACGVSGATTACLKSCASDSDCTTDYTCDATSHCVVKLAKGSICARNSQCLSASCADGYCADAACTESCKAADLPGFVGTCHEVPNGASPHGSRSCAPYAFCGASDCATSCNADGDCLAPSHCAAHVCVGTKPNGATCVNNGECDSAACTDSYCCESTCTTSCHSCAVPGNLGKCAAVDGAFDPRGSCPIGPCSDVCKAGACAVKSATSACGGTGSCAGATFTGSGHCSGSDTSCVGGASTPCAGGLTCADGATCKSKCLVDADCVGGFCDAASGLCVPARGDAGADAAVDAIVETGVDAAPEASPDSASADGLGIAETPAPLLAAKPLLAGDFTRCSQDSDCPTNHCVEGVCCDTACTDKCFSCALLTNPGTCTLEPVGVDLKNECGPGIACLGTCGPGGQCIGSGPGTMCARNTCTGQSTGLGPAYCSGSGAPCVTHAEVAFDCAPYVCEPAFGACKSACSTSGDCANGYVCDAASRACVTPAAPATPAGGGCSITTTGASPGFSLGWAALVFGAVGFGSRRRRRP